uniref:Uncharacterized protein n=1 Tax=Octopus bimaculoides TaxID=37653 RepID=A0A0L8G1S1_OCTBM
MEDREGGKKVRKQTLRDKARRRRRGRKRERTKLQRGGENGQKGAKCNKEQELRLARDRFGERKELTKYK